MSKLLTRFISLFFVVIVLLFSQWRLFNVYAETDPDLKAGYSMSCINLSNSTTPDPSSEMYTGYAPNNIYTKYMSGECKSSTPCIVASCTLPTNKVANENTGNGFDRIPDPTRRFCTTFNSALDIKYWGVDNSQNPVLAAFVLVNSPGNLIQPGSFVGIEARFDLTGGAESATEDSEETQGELRRRTSMHKYDQFYAIGDGIITVAPTTVPQVNPTTGVGNDYGLKQAGLGFDQAPTSAPTIAGTPKACTTIYWDPYGIVFDSDSLEPLNSAMSTISLLDEQGVPITPLDVSRSIIDKLGKYNIFISKDGMYKLAAESQTHSFINQKPNAKYKDLYETIFLPGDPAFLETMQKPVRMDIPLKSKTKPFTRPIEIYNKQIETSSYNGALYDLLTVRTTHPLSVVTVKSGGQLVTSDQKAHFFKQMSEKNGTWQAYLRKDLLTEYGVDIEIHKNPVYFPRTNTSTDLPIFIHFDPILTHIKGIASDNANKPIPNAKVQVKLSVNNTIFFETQADGTGLFSVPQSKLPPLSYYLTFIDPTKPNAPIIKTTTQFIKSNADYLEKEQLNLVTGRKEVGRKIPRDGALSPTVAAASPKQSSPFLSAILNVIVVIVLLIGGAVALFFISKKQGGGDFS